MIFIKNKNKWLSLIIKFYYIVTLSILSTFFWGCNSINDPVVSPIECDCPLPVRGVDGFSIPALVGRPELSIDGKKLLYNEYYIDGKTAFILDLISGSVTGINLNDYLSGGVQAVSQRAHWCPYDQNKLLFEGIIYNDSMDEGMTFYKVDIVNKTAEKLMPIAFDTIYNKNGNYIREFVSFGAWIKGSSQNNDSILAFWSLEDPFSAKHRFLLRHDSIYIPQVKEFAGNLYGALKRQSMDGTMFFSTDKWGPSGSKEFILNGEKILFEIPPIWLEYASWSTDNRYLALSVKPYKSNSECDTTMSFHEVWIIDVESYYNERPFIVPVKKINFQKSFCMYNLNGVYAEFISDTTLAVSMHKDGGKVSNLYEITIDGKIVRQLTFEP